MASPSSRIFQSAVFPRTGRAVTDCSRFVGLIRSFRKLKVLVAVFLLNLILDQRSYHHDLLESELIAHRDSEGGVQALTIESRNTNRKTFKQTNSKTSNLPSSNQMKLSDSEWQPPKMEQSLLGTTRSSDQRHGDIHHRDSHPSDTAFAGETVRTVKGGSSSIANAKNQNHSIFDASSLRGLMEDLSMQERPGKKPNLQQYERQSQFESNSFNSQQLDKMKSDKSDIIPNSLHDNTEKSGIIQIIPSQVQIDRNTHTLTTKPVPAIADPLEVEQSNLIRQYARLYVADPETHEKTYQSMIKDNDRLRTEFERVIAEIREMKRNSAEQLRIYREQRKAQEAAEREAKEAAERAAKEANEAVHRGADKAAEYSGEEVERKAEGAAHTAEKADVASEQEALKAKNVDPTADREAFVRLRKQLKQKRKAEEKAEQRMKEKRKIERRAEYEEREKKNRKESKRLVFGALKQYAVERKNARRELELEQQERFEEGSILNKRNLEALGISDPAVVEVIPVVKNEDSSSERKTTPEMGERESEEKVGTPEDDDSKSYKSEIQKGDNLSSDKPGSVDDSENDQPEKANDSENDKIEDDEIGSKEIGGGEPGKDDDLIQSDKIESDKAVKESGQSSLSPNPQQHQLNNNSSDHSLLNNNHSRRDIESSRASEKGCEDKKIEDKFEKMSLLNDEAEAEVGEQVEQQEQMQLDKQVENEPRSTPTPKKKRKKRKKNNEKTDPDTEKAGQEKADLNTEKPRAADLETNNIPEEKASKIEENLKKSTDPDAWREAASWVQRIGGALKTVREQKLSFQGKLEQLGRLLKEQDDAGELPVARMLSAKKKEEMRQVLETYHQLAKQLEQRENLQERLVKTMLQNKKQNAPPNANGLYKQQPEKQEQCKKNLLKSEIQCGDEDKVQKTMIPETSMHNQKCDPAKEKQLPIAHEKVKHQHEKDLPTRAEALVEAEIKSRLLKLKLVYNVLSSDVENFEKYCSQIEEVLGRFAEEFHGKLFPFELRKEFMAGVGRFEGDETYQKVEEAMMELQSTMRDRLIWTREKVEKKVLVSLAEKVDVLARTLLVDRNKTSTGVNGQQTERNKKSISESAYGNDVYGLCTDFCKGETSGNLNASMMNENGFADQAESKETSNPRLLQKKLSAEIRTRAREMSFILERTVDLWKVLRERMQPALVEWKANSSTTSTTKFKIQSSSDKNIPDVSIEKQQRTVTKGSGKNSESEMKGNGAIISHFLVSVITEGERLNLRGSAKMPHNPSLKSEPVEEEKKCGHQQTPHIHNAGGNKEVTTNEARYFLWREGFYSGEVEPVEAQLRKLEQEGLIRRKEAEGIFSKENMQRLWERSKQVMRVGDILFCDGEFMRKIKEEFLLAKSQMTPPEQTKRIIRV